MAGGSVYQDDDGGGGTISDINVTPLVDVTLVLLIIFMVTAKLIVARGISVESPKTKAGKDVKGTLAITVDKDRHLFIGPKQYDDRDAATAEIARRVKLTNEKAKTLGTKIEVKAIISADTNVPHGDVMRAIDIVKSGGVTKFALTTEPLEQKPSQ